MSKQAKRDYISEFAYNRAKKLNDDGTLAKAYSVCADKFLSFHVINSIIYNIASEAIDVLEEQRLFKHKIKKHWNESEKVYAHYQTYMRSNMNDESWFLLQDFCVMAWKNLERDIFTLDICVSNLLLRKKIANNNVVAKFATALLIAEILHELWGKYFKSFEDLCGVDFSPLFAYADISPMLYRLSLIYKELLPQHDDVVYHDNEDCEKALKILAKKLSDKKFLDNAARDAINLSPKLTEKYSDLLKKKQNDDSE